MYTRPNNFFIFKGDITILLTFFDLFISFLLHILLA